MQISPSQPNEVSQLKTELSSQPKPELKTQNPIRRLYQWTIKWAETKYAVPALAGVSFAESSFFPIPPDPLLMAICYPRPREWWKLAAITTIASVLGGILGYWIGWEFKPAAIWLLHYVGISDAEAKFAVVQSFYDRWGFLALIVKSLTPIPFKVFTIASGALHFHFGKFILGATIGRALRFFLVAGMIRIFGDKVKPWLEERLEWACLIFLLVVVLGFVAIKYLMPTH